MSYNNYFEQLRTAIPLLMREHGIPGASFTVVDREKVIFSDTYGYTDLSRTTPISPVTPFSIQSISKTYTALGFIFAVQDGKVSLDELLIKYVPSFSVKYIDGEDYSSLITFRQLLQHRSGLAHEAPIGNNFTYGSFEEHIKSINDTFLRFKPDEKYSYSNLGIDLVAYALGKIYDMPFEEFMQKKVFAPLDMDNSTFDQEAILLRFDSAIGHDKTSLIKYPISMLGAGGMYSCPNDMVKFILCVLNNGMHNGKSIVKDDILKQMYNQYPISNECIYHLGVEVGLWKNHVLVNHNGGGFGFFATQDILPDAGLGAVVLTNSVNHPTINHRICRNMWDDLLDLQDSGKEDCEPLTNEFYRYVGLYETMYNGGSWKLSVIPRNGMLYCNNQKLTRFAEDIFFTENGDCVKFSDNKISYNYVSADKHLK